MVLSFLPLSARLRARIGTQRALADVADATEVWAPPLAVEEAPILQLPDEMERVIAFNRTVTAAEFAERSAGGPRTHGATIARYYRRATIAGGTTYANGSYAITYPHRRPFPLVGKPQALADCLLASYWTVEQYFGHWLLDGLSLELLAEQSGHRAIGPARAPWTQEPGYRALTGIGLHRTGHARVEGLWIVDDLHMNQSRIDRMRELRRRVRARPPSGASGAPVFLRRVGGVRRPLLNQEALAEALARRGFTVLTPEEEPVERLRSVLHGARLVVSVEGSALCHAVAGMADGGTLLAIQPPRRVDWIQKAWTDCAGLGLAQTVADDRGEGFEIGEDRIMRLCDLIDARRGL